jgi:oligosaccharide 4-alpha-D-glucosyltransferase
MGMPQRRTLTIIVHGQDARPTQVQVNGASSDFTWDEKGKTLSLAISCDYQQSVEIKIM